MVFEKEIVYNGIISGHGGGFEGVVVVERGCLEPWGLFLEEGMVYNGIICGRGDGFGVVIVVGRAVRSRGGGFWRGNSV